jgi:hypothetical protein
MSKLVCFVTTEEGFNAFIYGLERDHEDDTLFILNNLSVLDISEEEINIIAHDDGTTENDSSDIIAEKADIVIDAICNYHNDGRSDCDGSCKE